MLGATGGFAAAVAHQWFIVPQIGGADTWLRQFLLGIALGAIVGAPIGFFQRYFDGISRHSFSVAARIGLMGALVGAAGGLTVFWLSEYLHHAVSGGYVGRAISVGLFGLSIGAAEALSGGSKRWRGLAGGLVGGILAGLLLEFLLRNFQDPDSAIIALMLLGTCIVAFSAFACSAAFAFSAFAFSAFATSAALAASAALARSAAFAASAAFAWSALN